MALFKKKEGKSKVDQTLELFNSLTDEELEEFMNKADFDGDGDVDEEDAKKNTTEQIDEAVEDAEEKGKEPTEAEVDESVAAQEEDEGDEDSQDAKDRVDEALGEDKEIEKEDTKEEEEPEEESREDFQEVIDGLNSRIASLEERLETIISKFENNDFGNHSAQVTEGDNDGADEDSRIMRSYMKKQAYRK